MNIQFQAKNLSLTDEQKDYISEKIGHLAKLDKHVDDVSSYVHVHVEKREIVDVDNQIEIDIKMTVPKGEFYAKETGITVEETIDKCVKKMRQQVEKYKAKHIHTHDGALVEEPPEGEFDSLL